MSQKQGRVLVVAGSDSGGGAGVQADIKTITALGGYAATALTALTAQDTKSVYDVVAVEPAFIAKQMAVVLADIGADIAKTGMLHNVAVIEVVRESLGEALPLVCDPVMVAKGGARLLEESAVSALRSVLVPRAFVLTPNLPEASLLAGFGIESLKDQQRAAEALQNAGAQAVLVKGGHGTGAEVVDVLAHQGGMELFRNPRLSSNATHGTGCTLASAIACGLALGQDLPASVQKGITYVREAMQAAPVLGTGHHPLAHNYRIKKESV